MAWGSVFSASLSGVLAWLIHSALVSLALLMLGSGGVLLWRQPARRARIIELTLLGCLVAPWLAMIPGYPKWGVRWWAREDRQEEDVGRPAPGTENGADLGGLGGFPGSAESPPVWDGLQIRPAVSAVPAASPPTTPRRGVDLAFAVIGLYTAGVGLGTAWWLVGIAGMARMLRKSCPAPPRCRELLDAIAGRNRGRVQLLVNRRLAQPLTAVWGRPVIVLPEVLCGDELAVRWSLAHEWSHVERHDFRAWLVAGLARALFFYHPLVWWLRRQLRVCQDFVADAAAARQAGQPEDYAEFLAIRAAAGSLHPAMVGLGMGFRKSELYRRVVMLVQNPPLESRTPRLWNALVSLAALVLIGILPALSSPPESAAQERKKAPQRKSSAAKEVAFAIGPNKFAKGDKIVIQEVWSELGSLAKGDTVTVKGTYTLASHYTATLLFSITQDARRGPQGGCTLERPVRAGSVPFELELPIAVDGHLHIGFYDIQTGGAFGNVYFGTYAQMREISHWDLEKWMNQGRGAKQVPGRRKR